METVVLVIDPSLTHRALLKVCLEREGYRVMTFFDPVEALCVLVRPYPQLSMPALALVASHVPKLPCETLIQLLKQHDLVVVALVTERDSIAHRIRLRLAGAACYIRKPVKRQIILEVVANHLPRRTLSASGRG